jgi:hypothetical protein
LVWLRSKGFSASITVACNRSRPPLRSLHPVKSRSAPALNGDITPQFPTRHTPRKRKPAILPVCLLPRTRYGR